MNTEDSIIRVINKRGNTIHSVAPQLVRRIGAKVFVVVGPMEVKYYDCEDVVLCEEFIDKQEYPS